MHGRVASPAPEPLHPHATRPTQLVGRNISKSFLRDFVTACEKAEAPELNWRPFVPSASSFMIDASPVATS
jgi:hypothetical protein